MSKIIVDKILSDLFVSKKTDRIIGSFTSYNHFTADLKAEIFLILCEMDKERILKASEGNYLYFLVSSIAKRQYWSKSSPFYNKYKKFSTVELNDNFDYGQSEDPSDIETLESIYDELNNLGFLDRELFKIYFKIDKYNPIDGELRDKNCNKAKSSFRKITKKLNMKTYNDDISVTTWYAHNSVTKTIKSLRKTIKDERID